MSDLPVTAVFESQNIVLCVQGIKYAKWLAKDTISEESVRFRFVILFPKIIIN